MSGGEGAISQITRIGPEDVDLIELSPSMPPVPASFKELSDNLQLICKETFPQTVGNLKWTCLVLFFFLGWYTLRRSRGL